MQTFISSLSKSHCGGQYMFNPKEVIQALDIEIQICQLNYEVTDFRRIINNCFA